MGHDTQRSTTPPGIELIERPAVDGWYAWPELIRPVARLRSPLLEHRAPRPLPPDPERTTLMLPAGRDLIGPIAWATLFAVPVLVLVGWQAALAVGATGALIRAVDGRMARTDLSFAGGFLGYRAPEWPRGVQEDDELRWNWSNARDGQGA